MTGDYAQMSSQNLTLGKAKNAQNAHPISLKEMRGGVKRESLRTEEEKSIFDSLDVNKDGILDESEMKTFTEDIQNAANKKNSENLSNGEAKDYLKNHGLKKIKKEDLFRFINNLSLDSENIKSCATDPETGDIIIEYNDGTKETINDANKSLTRTQTDDSEKTTTTKYKISVNDENERTLLPLEESVVESNGKDGTTTIYQLDEQGNPIKDKDGNYIPAQTTVISEEGQTQNVTTYENGTKKQETIASNKDNSTTVTDFENGIPHEKTITKEGSKTVIKYDENGKEATAVETQGEYTIKNYTWVDGKPRETSRIENKGLDTEKTTEFTYNENGTVVENISELGGNKKTTRVTKDGKPLAEEITEGNKKIQREWKEDGSATEIIRNGEDITQNQLNSDGHRLTQIKVVNGEQYQIQYDGKGNTEGIIVQNGESPAAIAKKFGVPLDKLLEANSDKTVGKGKNRYFRVGDSIKIPREMEADEKVLQGRKSSAQAVAEYERDEQIRAQQRARVEAENKALKELGLINRKGAGTKVTGDFYNKGKKVSSIQLTQIGNATHGRTICKDKKGKIYVVAHDGVILKDSYVQVSAHRQTIVVGNARYAVEGSRGDKHGRMIVLDADGKSHVLSGGKSKTDLSDRVILRDDYVSASDARDNGQSQRTVTGGNGITYVKDKNGKVWYFDEKTGKALVKGEYSNFVQQESNAISERIYNAAHGIGTDEEELQQGVSQIYSPEILSRVNTTLASKDSDYKGDANTMPLEALILDEETHGNSRKYFRTLINSGAMTTEQKGNTIARELKHEIEGGLGYTSTSSVNEVMNLVPEGDRDTRLAVESSVSRLKPDLKANEGSVVRAYLADDGWNAQEVDQFDSNWVANKSYKPGVDQEHRNAVIGRLCFDYDDKEALHKGLKACSDNPDSEDYKYLSQRAEQANKDRGYQTQFTDQEAVQTYLAGRSNDGGEVDVEQLSACNTLLFKSTKPVRVQAEEALYGAKKGDMSNVFNSMDSEVYDSMAEIMANGDIPGCKTIKDAYNKAYASANPKEKTSIKANAILSGHVDFSKQEITDFCIELMHSIDDNKGKGGSTGMSASHTNDAEYQTEQLKAILTQHPEIIADVKAQVEKGNFSSTTTITTAGNPGAPGTTTAITTDTKAGYLDIINNTQCIVKEEVFLDENGKRITDPTKIAALKQANMEALQQMREYVAQLEREFKMGVDEEGWLDDAGNGLVRYSGIGTDRGDVANKYREAKNALKRLEAAAQGRLRDNNGNVVSAQQLAQSIIDSQDNLAQTNADYKSSVGMAKMGIVLAPVIVATTVVTGGTAATGWAAVGVGAATTATVEGVMYGTNLLTSETGNTAENRAAVTSQVAQDTALAALGIKAGQYAENFAVNGIKAASAAERSAFSPQSWKIISKVPEGKVKDFFGAVSKASAKLEQASADVGASVISKQANLLRKAAPGISEAQIQKAAVILARGEAAGLEITSDTVQTLGQMYLVDGEFNEESFIEGMIMSVAGNSIGHMTSLKSELKAAGEGVHAGDGMGGSVKGKVDQGNSNRVNEGSANRVDEGSANRVDEGSANRVDEGSANRIDEGSANRIDEGSTNRIDEGSANRVDEGSANRVDEGSTNRVDEGSTNRIDEGSANRVDEGSANRIDEGSGSGENSSEVFENTATAKGLQIAKRMKNYVSSIRDADIPQAMKNTWEKCKAEILELSDAFSMPNININTSALSAKYHSIMNNLSAIASKATTEIKAQLKQLMDKIKEMFNSLELSVKNSAGINPNITGRPDLDKYTTPQNKSMRISKENRELAKTYNVDESHIQFIQDNPKLFKDNHMYGYWQGNQPADQHHGAWKMHMFSVDEADWQKMSQTLIPYLNDHGIEWKTLNMVHDVSHLNGDIQQGKAFTIYPRDNAHMEQVARDLDYIIKRNNLNINASDIVGDRQMGNSGRLFYRYEFKTKQAQDEILDLSNRADYNRYRQLYDSNEGRVNRHGAGSYLADDMTEADDPWLNFDPGNQNSKPGLGQSTPQNFGNSSFSNSGNNQGFAASVTSDFSHLPAGTRLPKGQGVTVSSDATLILANQIELDLSSPGISNRLRNLKNGESLSVGRAPNNDIVINNQYVSGNHLTIQKQGDKLVVIENSTNGTTIGESLPQLDANELVRVAGNNGKPIDADYIRTSKEARSHLNQAIESGDYTRDLNSYIETINSMHEIAYHGKDGTHEWYSKAGQGSLNVNPGVIRNDRTGLRNRRIDSARDVELIAKQYGDSYRVDENSKVYLDGIPDRYLPRDGAGGYHFYPAGEGLEKYYYKEMHRTSKEALKLIQNGAPKQKILEKLAEHYQYAANARPYGQINNSLFMNELNTLLTKAGLPTMPHGTLDIAAMHLQPATFKKYFVDQYNKTALNSTQPARQNITETPTATYVPLASASQTAKTSVLTEIEAKYLPQLTQYPEQTIEVLNTISTRIKNGGIPSQEMLNGILEDISATSGISIRDLTRDFNKSMTVLSSDWQGINQALKTPEAKMIEDINNGGSLSRNLENFKIKRNLQPDTRKSA